MLQHFSRFGNPSQILTDNGTQFVNGTIEELLKLCGLEHVKVLAYSKEENSIVERANKEVMRHLRAIVYDFSRNENIRDILPLVQRIINSSKNSSNGASPSEILFGNAIHLDRGILIPEEAIPAGAPQNVSLSVWASKMLKAQKAIIAKAELVQRTKDAEHVANADPRRTEFPVGSYVLVEYNSSILRRGPDNKFNTHLKGPFKVVKKVLSTYTLYDSNTRKDIDEHIAKLHPFIYDSRFVDPVDVARRDVLTSMLVTAVIAHSGNKARRSTLDFSVQFQGLDGTQVYWLPYSEMRDNPLCHAYLLAHNMKTLIPKEHRLGEFK